MLPEAGLTAPWYMAHRGYRPTCGAETAGDVFVKPVKKLSIHATAVIHVEITNKIINLHY